MTQRAPVTLRPVTQRPVTSDCRFRLAGRRPVTQRLKTQRLKIVTQRPVTHLLVPQRLRDAGARAAEARDAPTLSHLVVKNIVTSCIRFLMFELMCEV